MNKEKRITKEKLDSMTNQVRIGGKGTVRRKKKIVHVTQGTDDKKLQSSLKKLAVNTVPGIEEVNMIRDDGTVIHFNNPKTQASLNANTFAITGHGETKKLVDLLPGILNQLGTDNVGHLKQLADSTMANAASITKNSDDVEIPEVGNFDDVLKNKRV